MKKPIRDNGITGLRALFNTLALSPVSLAAILILAGILVCIGFTFLKQIRYMAESQTEESIFDFSYLEKTYEKGPPSKQFIFGTDDEGISVAERTLAGARISIMVGVVGALVSVFVGTLYGLVSGYAGGKLDMIMMRFVDVVYSLPYMFIVIILIALFARSIWMLFIALGLVYWLTIARIVRGQVLSLKEREFVIAARAIGAGHMRIIFRHVLPNLIGIVIVYLTLTIPRLMLQESFLSFLGLNVRGQEHSWGTILNEAVVSSSGTDWWMILFPGGFMFITLLALTIIGEKLKETYEK